jgi:hypothetical protein
LLQRDVFLHVLQAQLLDLVQVYDEVAYLDDVVLLLVTLVYFECLAAVLLQVLPSNVPNANRQVLKDVLRDDFFLESQVQFLS